MYYKHIPMYMVMTSHTYVRIYTPTLATLLHEPAIHSPTVYICTHILYMYMCRYSSVHIYTYIGSASQNLCIETLAAIAVVMQLYQYLSCNSYSKGLKYVACDKVKATISFSQSLVCIGRLICACHLAGRKRYCTMSGKLSIPIRYRPIIT